MKAIVTQLQPDKTRRKGVVENWPEPEGPKGKEVKTHTLYSGVTNGSERNDLTRGNYARGDEDLPAGWGYQNVGKVIETGPDVKDLKVGDVLYMSGDHMEYNVIPEDSLLVKIPESVDKKQAALFGMASVAMRTCRNAELRMGHKFLIVGAGFIGQVAAQIANVMGARVTLCDINEQRLEIARKIGAAETVVNVSGDGWKDHIEDFTYDAVLDVAGVAGMETKLIQAAKPRGTVLFIAGRFKVEYEFNQGQGHEIVIKQNSHFDRDDLENLCRLVERKMVRIEPFVKDVVTLDQSYKIYDTLRDEPQKLFGTVFDWQNA